MPEISPYAIVEDTADIAADVKVGAFCYIGEHVRIGAGCIVENNVTVIGKTKIGQKNHIFPMAVIGTSMGRPDEEGKCVIGEGNVIREHATLYAGIDRPTQIGNGNLIMIGCMIGPGAQISDHGVFDNLTSIHAGATVEEYVWTSGYTQIEANATVGAYTFTVGYSCIDRDVPPFAMIQGFPIRVRGVNTRNLKRCGFGDDDIRAIKAAFRELFNGAADYLNADALEKLQSHSNLHVRRLAEAVQRGLQRSAAE